MPTVALSPSLCTGRGVVTSVVVSQSFHFSCGDSLSWKKRDGNDCLPGSSWPLATHEVPCPVSGETGLKDSAAHCLVQNDPCAE